MIRHIQKLFGKDKIKRLLRSIYRNRRFRLVIALSFFVVITVIIISQLEKNTNEPFRSVLDVLYWAVVTVSTVGYGDITVHNIISKILAIFLIVAGVLLMSFMTATFASIFTATRIREGMGLKKIELDNHIVICGFNDKIESVIQGIKNSVDKTIPDIVLINSQPESEISDLTERFPGINLHFVYGDYTSESTLLRASIAKASSVIILADPGPEATSKPDDRTLLAVLTIKSIMKELEVSAEVLDSSSVPHIRRAGVDQVVVSGEFSGFLLANAVMSPGIPQALRDIIIKEGSDIQRISMPHDLIGKTFVFAVLEFIDRFGQLLIGVITEKKSFNLENVLTAETSAIDAFIRRKFDEAGRSLEIESKGRFTVQINPGKDYKISEYDYAIVLTPKKVEA